MYIGLHMVIIKFHKVLIENDLQLDINAKRDLESQNKIRNEFLDPIMCKKVIPYMIKGLLVVKSNLLIISKIFYVN